MAGTYVALLRGINVGRAKRIAMADLREVLTGLGYSHPRTVLQSGNAVFEAAARLPSTAATDLQAAVLARTGVDSRVVVLSADELAVAAEANPLLGVATDLARLLVAVPGDPADLVTLATPLAEDWSPEAFAVGERAVYLWCADGIMASRLAPAVDKLRLVGPVTMRNVNTVRKILAVAGRAQGEYART